MGTAPFYFDNRPEAKKKRLKAMPPKLVAHVEGEVKALLHAHRDCLRTRFHAKIGASDPKQIRVNANDGYYGEAFGIMRALNLMGYGYFGSSNLDAVKEERSHEPKQNLKWWFEELEREVLEEEHFKGNGECAYCFQRHHQDDARPRP